MKPTAYITAFFDRTVPTQGEAAAYNFDRISSYFYHTSAEETCFQIIDAETITDLDLNVVFERIDRTTSRVGQQQLYARLCMLRGESDTQRFVQRTEHFSKNPELSAQCIKHLTLLTDDDAYELQNLIFDTPAQIRNIGLIYLLTGCSTLSLLLSPFYPPLLLFFLGIFVANLYFHYSNKLNISLYSSAVGQRSKSPAGSLRRTFPALPMPRRRSVRSARSSIAVA